jgi:hypothetical protein
MISPLICLSFVHALQGGAAHIPEHVDQLVKSRLLQQLKNTRPSVDFRFDETFCPEKVTYYFSGDSLVTTSESPLWTKRFEFNLTEILDGRKMDFPFLASTPEEVEAEKNLAASALAFEKPEREKKWIPWVLGSVGLALAAFLISKESASGKANSGPNALRLRSF